jgi:hypothetical protein
MEKTCKKCGESKLLTEFYGAAGARDGLRGECKECNAAAKRDWYGANKDAVKRRSSVGKHENAERHNAATRRRRQDPARKRKERDGNLRRTFGIAIEQHDLTLALQNGVCAICKEIRTPTSRCTSITTTRQGRSEA